MHAEERNLVLLMMGMWTGEENKFSITIIRAEPGVDNE